jgi:outer membrane lipoprotein-sorting protein
MAQMIDRRTRSTTRSASNLLLAFIFFVAASGISAAETKDLLNSWLAAQTNLQTWSADFVQTRTLKSLAQPAIATGKVSFAAPDKFHWEISEPSPTLAIRSGPELWVIYPKLKRAERYPLTGTAGPWRDTLALLEAGFPRSQADLESRFRVRSQVVTNGICAVDLQPKSASARRMIPRITILFGTNDFTLRATELAFADGSTMRNSFTNGVINPKLDQDLFTPKPGADFTITDPTKSQKR